MEALGKSRTFEPRLRLNPVPNDLAGMWNGPGIDRQLIEGRLNPAEHPILITAVRSVAAIDARLLTSSPLEEQGAATFFPVEVYEAEQWNRIYMGTRSSR
jgi:hypothetical protein